MEELLMRMQAILRRTDETGKAAEQENIYQIGNYTFDYNRQVLTFRGKENKLTSKERDCCSCSASTRTMY